MGIAAEELGLSASTGAFAAGVILAGTNYRAQIQADIRPFEGILLGIFFMTAGGLTSTHAHYKTTSLRSRLGPAFGPSLHSLMPQHAPEPRHVSLFSHAVAHSGRLRMLTFRTPTCPHMPVAPALPQAPRLIPASASRNGPRCSRVWPASSSSRLPRSSQRLTQHVKPS